MKQLINLEFNNVDALSPRENIAYYNQDGLVVKISRRMRTTPFIGMKQPLLNHAIMGLETFLEISIDNRPAIGYQWKLYNIDKKKKFIQKGIIDDFGCSENVQIGLNQKPEKYSLVVFTPKKARKPSLLPAL